MTIDEGNEFVRVKGRNNEKILIEMSDDGNGIGITWGSHIGLVERIALLYSLLLGELKTGMKYGLSLEDAKKIPRLMLEELGNAQND